MMPMSAGEGRSEETFFASMEESFRSLGSEYKMNRAVSELNCGEFKAVPLFGRLRDVTTQPTTIEGMTFNSFPELSLGPLLLLDDGACVFKGSSAQHPAASPDLYAVQTPFTILEPEFKLAQKSGEGSWVPTSGVCTVIGTNKPSEDKKQLSISLERVELTLTDTGNGFTRNDSDTEHKFESRQFETPYPGSHEVLLMTPELTVVKGNFGSLFLLFPVKKQ